MQETTIVVENVAKTQQGIVAGDKWYNFPKGSTKKFENINKGDTVVLAINEDGKVEEYKVTQKSEPKKAYTGSKSGGFAPRGKTPEEQALIVRQVAVKAAFENKTLADLENGFETLAEAAVKIEQYITKGKF
jgi:phage/plasmid primase-like uncharacterized protein